MLWQQEGNRRHLSDFTISDILVLTMTVLVHCVLLHLVIISVSGFGDRLVWAEDWSERRLESTEEVADTEEVAETEDDNVRITRKVGTEPRNFIKDKLCDLGLADVSIAQLKDHT